MGDKDETVWLINRPAWLYLLATLIGLLIGLPLGLLIFSFPPLWAFIPGSLIAAVILIPALARTLVFRVGISDEKVVFKKVHRKIEIKKSEVLSIDVFLPFDPSDLAKPWFRVRDRRVTIELRGGKSLRFFTIEPQIVHQLLRVFKKQKNTS
ncbi:MAG: hypothetical protein E3J35_05785 [Methanomassiliicoccales archaeon]|nr:MAG: hypothetical protein E3J35_05785 [Methanomassiliicoccales archaeon]